MLGDIVGGQIARGAHGLSDAHFDYTAAVERLLAVYFGVGLSLSHLLAGNTLTETLHALRWEAHGAAGIAGAEVTVTFGGVLLHTFVVPTTARFRIAGCILRTGVGAAESMSEASAPPAVIDFGRVSPAVDMTVNQSLVVTIDNGVIDMLKVKLSGAP